MTVERRRIEAARLVMAYMRARGGRTIAESPEWLGDASSVTVALEDDTIGAVLGRLHNTDAFIAVVDVKKGRVRMIGATPEFRSDIAQQPAGSDVNAEAHIGMLADLLEQQQRRPLRIRVAPRSPSVVPSSLHLVNA